MDSLGVTIREARKKLNITMVNLAKQSGLTQGYLSKIENNVKIPTHEVLQKLSKLLEIPFMELMVKAGYIKSLGQTIKDLRDDKGWTLEDLERETINFEYGNPIFISKDTLSKLENDEYKNPSVFEIYLLSEAFQVPTHVFSTLDLQTPNGDLVSLLEIDGAPNPMEWTKHGIEWCKEEYEKTEYEWKKEELIIRITELEALIPKYISQLNSLSANGEVVININDISELDKPREKLFELDENEQYKFSFSTPSKKIEVNGLPLYVSTTRKENEMSFFDLNNLLYLDNKVNFNGNILSKKQKKEILDAISKIIK